MCVCVCVFDCLFGVDPVNFACRDVGFLVFRYHTIKSLIDKRTRNKIVFIHGDVSDGSKNDAKLRFVRALLLHMPVLVGTRVMAGRHAKLNGGYLLGVFKPSSFMM